MTINEKVKNRLEELGIKSGKFVSKMDYNTISFRVIDPVENKVLKEYTFLESEFNNLPYNEKGNYTKLKKVTNFNEEAYEAEKKRQDKIQKIYDEKYKEVEKEILKEEGYTEKEFKGLQTLKSLMDFHFDIDTIDEEAEKDFLDFLKNF